MSELIEKYLQHMLLKGYSVKTKEVYLESIIGLVRFHSLPPDQMTGGHLCGYLQYGIEKCHWSRSRVNQVISAMKILWIAVLGREWDTMTLPRPRSSKTLLEVLSHVALDILRRCELAEGDEADHGQRCDALSLL